MHAPSSLHRVLRQGASVELAEELQVGGAGEIEVEARNRYGLRREMRVGELSKALEEASVAAIHRALRRNHGKVIDRAAHGALPHRAPSPRCTADSMHHVWLQVIDLLRGLDPNGDGLVTKAEFREALPLLGFGKGGTYEMDKLFDAIDVDESGTLEYEELQELLKTDGGALHGIAEIE